jgi:hypothetical protein
LGVKMSRHGLAWFGEYTSPSGVCQVVDGSLLVGNAMVSTQFILTMKDQ